MIKISVDEGYAFDCLSILEVKNRFSPSEESGEKLRVFEKNIKDQIGPVFFTIKASKEYGNLYKTNEFLFAKIDESKKGRVPASYIDYLNWVRFIHKSSINDSFFKDTSKEIKLGYGWKYIKLENSFLLALVDQEDFDAFSGQKWKNSLGYAIRANDGKRMHRIVMKDRVSEEDLVDHINLNGLDNRKCNLRLATHVQNRANVALTSNNKTGYKGILFDKLIKRWAARIKYKKQNIHIGSFDKKEQAALAYDIWAFRIYGEFARKNIHEPIEEDIRAVINSAFKKYAKNQKYSKFYGVSYLKSMNVWRARLTINGVRVHLGTFQTSKEAADAVDKRLDELGMHEMKNFSSPTMDQYKVYIEKVLAKIDSQ